MITVRLIRFGAASPSCTCGHLSAAGSAAPVLMAGGSSHHLLIPALCPVLPLISRCKYNTVYQILKTRQYSVELSENWDLVIEKAQRGLCLSSLPLLRGAFPPECFFRTPNQSHDAFTRSSLSCFKRCRRQSCQNLSKLFSCSPDSLADLFSNSFEDAPCCFRVTSLITRGVFFLRRGCERWRLLAVFFLVEVLSGESACCQSHRHFPPRLSRERCAIARVCF